MTSILLIGGSAEGHALAKALTTAGCDVRAILPSPLRTDPGGVDYEVLGDACLDAMTQGAGPVILATHPNDSAFRAELPDLCAERCRPLLHLCRPPWRPTPQDNWHLLKDDSAVPVPIPEGARVFVGLGREVLDLRDALAGRYLVIRQLGPATEPWPGNGHYLESFPEFTVDDEIEMLKQEAIDWLLVRNAGGTGGWPKLAAARALGLPVAMLPRPALMPGVPVAETVEDALQWIKGAEFCQNSAERFLAKIVGPESDADH